jgi:hypothetical protein
MQETAAVRGSARQKPAEFLSSAGFSRSKSLHTFSDHSTEESLYKNNAEKEKRITT